MSPRKKQVLYRPTMQRVKTQRAFAAYLALLDAADKMRSEMSRQLVSSDLTMGDFRLLELLHREGPMSLSAAAKKRQCKRQNLDVILAHLMACGWVSRETVMFPPAEIKESRLPRALRGQEREGRRVGILHLTPLGEKFVGVFLPKHKKVVKAFMRVLQGKQQMALARMCDKVREGDVRKFVDEITLEDFDDQES